MLTLQTAEKRKVNPYRVARRYGSRLLTYGLPLLTLAFLWYKAIALGGFEDGMTGTPAMIAAFAIVGSIFVALGVIVWIWPYVSKVYGMFTDWWKRQEAEYDRIED